MSAWFVDDNLDMLSAPPKTPADNKELLMRPIVSDPLFLGVKSDAWAPGGKCNIEFINGSPMNVDVHAINKATPLKLTGWAMDDEYARLPKSVIVRFANAAHGHFYSLARIGLIRADVLDYFKLPISLIKSGFEVLTTVREMSEDEYRLTLIIQFEDMVYICDNGRKIHVQE